MAFRSKAQTGAFVVLWLWAVVAAAEPLSFPVRHRHLRHAGQGLLRVSDDGIQYQESGKRAAKDSRQWRFEDIEQLTLGGGTLRILTYEDRQWPHGDREFVFDGLPKDGVARLYPLFSARLDQRFVAALADNAVKPAWEIPAKLLGPGGRSQGVLLVGADRVVYRTDAAEQSRTWRIPDIDMVTSSGPFELTVTTFERGSGYGDRREFRFQLKRPLTAAEYDGLWRRVNQAKGLEILGVL